jgi:predicted small lipoprotein YifL
MLRDFLAMLRPVATAPATAPAAAMFTLLLVAAALSACGIKGALRPPPAAAASTPAPSTPAAGPMLPAESPATIDPPANRTP